MAINDKSIRIFMLHYEMDFPDFFPFIYLIIIIDLIIACIVLLQISFEGPADLGRLNSCNCLLPHGTKPLPELMLA